MGLTHCKGPPSLNLMRVPLVLADAPWVHNHNMEGEGVVVAGNARIAENLPEGLFALCHPAESANSQGPGSQETRKLVGYGIGKWNGEDRVEACPFVSLHRDLGYSDVARWAAPLCCHTESVQQAAGRL